MESFFDLESPTQQALKKKKIHLSQVKVHFITIKVCIVWRGHRLLNVPLVGKKVTSKLLQPKDAFWYVLKGLHPGKLRWNLKITCFDMGNHLPKLHFWAPC